MIKENIVEVVNTLTEHLTNASADEEAQGFTGGLRDTFRGFITELQGIVNGEVDELQKIHQLLVTLHLHVTELSSEEANDRSYCLGVAAAYAVIAKTLVDAFKEGTAKDFYPDLWIAFNGSFKSLVDN